MVTFYKSILPALKYKGFVCVKKVDDLIKWVEYCIKDRALMQEILDCELPITENSQILQKFRNHTKKCKKIYNEVKKGEYKGKIVEQCNTLGSSSTASAGSDIDFDVEGVKE